VVGGVGFGARFSGALRGLAPLTEVHERAGLFAAIFAVSHLAFGLPAIVPGSWKNRWACSASPAHSVP
jgi:hypothetical protein